MDIYVLDGLNGAVGMIDLYESVIWNTQYFGLNDFQLVVAGSDENIALFTEGRYLVRDKDMNNGTYTNVMVIQNVQLDFDTEKGWVLTLTGGGLKSIVGKRVVWNQLTMTGNVEKAIRQVITDNIISPTNSARQITNFTLADEVGFTDTSDIQLLGNNIAEWLQTICQTYAYGWDVYISGGQYIFKLYQGTDRTYNQDVVAPVVFSPEFDNLLSSTYSYNRINYKNAALIGGEGDGVNKRTASIGTATGLERCETYIDGSSVSSNGDIITVDQYTQLLESYGQEQLTQTQLSEKFDGSVEPTGMYNINEDYFLGDMVQISNEKGISATPRIIEIIYSEDENGTSVVPTFTKWEVE